MITRSSCRPPVFNNLFKSFSSCYPRKGHYETLGVPRHATKSQIKSRYYQLSKRYHPDVTGDPEATKAFQAVTEAYAVLGDESRRRAFDRYLSNASPTSSDYQSPWPHETRRRGGATYAWETHHHPLHRRPHPKAQQCPKSRPRNAEQQHLRKQGHLFSSDHVQDAPGSKTARARQMETHRVQRESTFWRALQVIGIILVVTTVGGWRATVG